MNKYISNFPHGIMFHHFHDETHPPSGQGSISAKEFEEILNFIGIENIIGPDEWIAKLSENKLKENDLCITFDDGLKSQYDICVPILEKYDLKCFWFVYSSVFEGILTKLEIYSNFRTKYFEKIDDFYELFFSKYENSDFEKIDKNRLQSFVHKKQSIYSFYSFNDIKFRFMRDEILVKNEYEKLMDEIIQEKGIKIVDIEKNLWLTNSHLKILSENGHEIGLHSYDHPTVLSKLSYEEQYEQYEKNYMHIKQVCNKDVLSMAHPSNSYSDDTLKILRRLNIVCGFRSNRTPPEGKKINPSSLEIGREDHTNILKKIRM